jgi:hypothetical protein
LLIRKTPPTFSAPIARSGAYDNSESGTQDAAILFDALEDSAAHRLNFALREALKSGNNDDLPVSDTRASADCGASGELTEYPKT